VVALAAFGAAWISVVALLTEADQNSGLSRYVLPTYAVLAVLGGIGWAEAGREIVRRLSSSRGSGRRYPVLLAGAAVAVVGLLALDSATSWLREISVEAGELSYQAGLQHSLAPAIAAAGGAEEVRSCGQVWTSTYQVPFVAWTLNERIRDVWSQQGPGLPESAYVGPLLQTRDRRDAPIAPVPFDFLAYRTAGTAESAGATWTIQLPADCG
jgi:hypothetical protein